VKKNILELIEAGIASIFATTCWMFTSINPSLIGILWLLSIVVFVWINQSIYSEEYQGKLKEKYTVLGETIQKEDDGK